MTPHDPERDRTEQDRVEREFRRHIREGFRDKEDDYRRRLADARAFFGGSGVKTADKLDRLRRFFRDRVGEMESWGDPALDDRMRGYLADCRALMRDFPAVFPTAPTDDEAILLRLAEIGPYALVRDSRSDTVDWPPPNAVTCDWCEVRLVFDVQTGQDHDGAYREVLARWDGFRPNAAPLLEEFREEVVGHFASAYEEGRPRAALESEGYAVDADGFVTEESILSRVGPVTVVLSNVLGGAAFRCAVPWDDEHGVEAESDETWRLRRDR